MALQSPTVDRASSRTRVRVVEFSPCAPVAQLDRASGYEPEGRGFESLRARHFLLLTHLVTDLDRLLLFMLRLAVTKM
jgi:hypothetical protein